MKRPIEEKYEIINVYSGVQGEEMKVKINGIIRRICNFHIEKQECLYYNNIGFQNTDNRSDICAGN